jgi:hypothetical protein
VPGAGGPGDAIRGAWPFAPTLDGQPALQLSAPIADKTGEFLEAMDWMADRLLQAPPAATSGVDAIDPALPLPNGH